MQSFSTSSTSQAIVFMASVTQRSGKGDGADAGNNLRLRHSRQSPSDGTLHPPLFSAQPVGQQTLAMFVRGDRRVGVEGVLDRVRQRDFFQDRAALGAEAVAGARLDHHHVARLAVADLAVEIDPHVAVEHVETLLLDLVVLFGMGLARQQHEDFLAISAVDRREHGQAELVEAVDAVVVRDFQVDLGRQHDAALPQQVADAADDGVDLFAEIDALDVGGQQRGLGGDGFLRAVLAVFRDVLGRQLAVERGDGQQDVGGRDVFAGGEGPLGESPAAQATAASRSRRR